MYETLEVKKQWAHKAHKKKKDNPTVPFRAIAKSFGICEQKLARWVREYVEPNFKNKRKGTYDNLFY